eukprot:GHRR01021989.1.p1 GENE.GHRR01021989.1~~GHRR01021989.1.p1  ORF type:complete len:168 (-),score=8.29 GHRR01021989.1:923-1426(-)
MFLFLHTGPLCNEDTSVYPLSGICPAMRITNPSRGHDGPPTRKGFLVSDCMKANKIAKLGNVPCIMTCVVGTSSRSAQACAFAHDSHTCCCPSHNVEWGCQAVISNAVYCCMFFPNSARWGGMPMPSECSHLNMRALVSLYVDAAVASIQLFCNHLWLAKQLTACIA